MLFIFFFSSRRRHTRCSRDWSSDVCSSDLVCLEHFTGRPNPQTYGMGLAPHLLALWIAHEVAHAVRYTSPSSRADLKRLVADLRGNYDYWDTGSRASLRELLVNEGVAVAAAQAVAPAFEPWEYFGYT